MRPDQPNSRLSHDNVSQDRSSTSPAIEARDVRVALSGREILHGLSFEVPKGTWLGIVGPNGSGKTTLLRALASLIPYDGQINLAGRDLLAWPARQRSRHVAVVTQSVPMAFDFTVRDLVLLGRSPHKTWLAPYDGADREAAQAALRQVDMAGFEDRSVLALSGGEQRRVLLAQALAQDSEVLLLDEPTSHLDVHHEFEFLQHVRTMVDGGRTAIGIFHDLEMAARCSDRLLILHEGRAEACGVPEDAVTADLLRRVFRMDADIGTSPAGDLSIHFKTAIRRTAI